MKYLLILLTISTTYCQNLKIKLSNVSKSFEFYGSVEPKYQSKLSPLVEGQVFKRNVEIGDIVQKGQVLYVLDPYPQNFQLSSANIEKGRLENRLKFLKLKLSRRVKNEEAYTEEIVEEVQLQVQDTLLQIQAIETKIDLLKEALAKKEIKAPYDGVVLEYYKDPGEFSPIGNPILNMVSIKNNFIKVLMNRLHAKLLKKKQVVSLMTDDKMFEGKVMRIHPSEDKNHMRTVDMKSSFSDELVVNQVVKVKVQMNKKVVKIPREFVKNIHGFSTIKVKLKDSSSLKRVLGDFVFDDFVSENLALEGLILERF
ncbi:MAG: efflux RND transporter periplasmic adaptor subunit [Candidatus Cloacimonetes bacterium]|nr:efflux RND transporter periplasmic adaptor subunit [Candidatus Cloacimonadota bacterium]